MPWPLLLADRDPLVSHTCESCSPAAAAECPQSCINAAGLADGGTLLRGGPCCTPQQAQDSLAASHCDEAW
jgi:hypothetical protein